MAENRLEFSRSDIERLIRKLDIELSERGHSVTLYIVGGANMALAVDGSRTTADIDAVVKRGFDQLADAAAAVALTEPGLAPDWVNAEFTGGDHPNGGLFWQWFDRRDDDEPRTVFRGAGLCVEIASPEMMLALKTLGNRDQDIADAFQLMRKTGIRTPLDLGRNLARFTGPRIFQVQGTDGVYPRIDPAFPHIFDNAPEDLRPPAAAREPTRLAGRVQRLLLRWRRGRGEAR